MLPKKAFDDQVWHSIQRGIGFNFAYEEWLEIWLLSGRWKQRGKEKGQYQMCRFYDEGPYSKNNCYIGTVEENQKERHKIPDGETGDIISDWLGGWYTQSELGKMYNLSQSAISKIVNGKRRGNEIYT